MNANTRIPTRVRCTRCGLAAFLCKVRGSSGWRYCHWCASCDCAATPERVWLPAKVVLDGRKEWQIPVRQSKLDDLGDGCAVCGVVGPVEVHHLAPRAQFGTEADVWPVVLVCRRCHERWHEKMGQPIAVPAEPSTTCGATVGDAIEALRTFGMDADQAARVMAAASTAFGWRS